MSELNTIIVDLNRQLAAIERALTALRDVGSEPKQSETTSSPKAPTRRRLSADARRRMADAQKRRWAAVRSAKE